MSSPFRVDERGSGICESISIVLKILKIRGGLLILSE